ncbi:putative 3-phytase protein [Eutypa lata UCREL1]|uniref:Putative 3-phytase protein n=1 Tax=Eutypa lata (strain UCR-EL1) TaxID=1287681 RepID=M7T831_EUTLA|nr:putative 3-phytase protein [Eutypa lata UCREL1]
MSALRASGHIVHPVSLAVSEVELPILARIDEADSDWTAVIYDAENPSIVGNDGGAASGGFRIFRLNGENPLPEAKHETPGRTKLVTTVYDIQEQDIIVTIAQTDSFFRLYNASSFEQIGQPLAKTLGDWSALCAWKSQTSGEQYLYLFGKSQAVQFLLRGQEGSLDITEIQTFETPVEASSCAVSLSDETVFFSGDDNPAVYAFGAAESTTVPRISVLGEAADDVTSLAVYYGNSSDYLAVAQTDVVALYDVSFTLLGSWRLTGDEDIEVQGLSFYQETTPAYPAGVMTYAIERHGDCVGANQCECEDGWGGLYCAFKVVKPIAETDANGGDGDDPAIWVNPINKGDSRIITTTKSEVGAGFAAIAGGVQPTKEDYEVYGSCVYRSRATGKQYLFVNAKTAEYLQYELTWVDDALHTTLVRNFTGGSGGQVEGCVSDEANGWVLIGEEPFGLWRYGAEPGDDASSGYLIASINDTMYADVEGVTLIEGASADEGFILVSQQGVSAYNVYRRTAPHDFVETFTIYENVEKGVDQVTNTDGITAIGTFLSDALPKGLIVVHDDANQLPSGGTSDETSFKLVSVEDVIPEQLLSELDPNWDPRATLTRRRKL